MSMKVVLGKVNNLLLEIKKCFKQEQTILPLVKCKKQFDYNKKIMVRTNPVHLCINRNTITQILRLVEILTIIRNLLINNKFITKRNLYYQLLKYYKHYQLIDDDLLIISDTLKMERSAFNIIVSSKLQLFWFNSPKSKNYQIKCQLSYKKFTEQNESNQENPQSVNIFTLNHQINTSIIQKQHILLIPNQIFKIPNCPKLQVTLLYPNKIYNKQQKKINVLILEKESIFEILTESLLYKAPQKNEKWFLLNSKGYPDNTAQRFTNQMLKLSVNQDIQFYYMGDLDAYGIDIMLNYAIGNQIYQGLWKKLKWLCKTDEILQIQNNKNKGFKKKFEQSEYHKQTPQQVNKCQQILKRQYFQIQKFSTYNQLNQKQQIKCESQFLFKIKNWKKMLQQLGQKGWKCQIQSYFKHLLYPFELIQLMIQNGLYV